MGGLGPGTVRHWPIWRGTRRYTVRYLDVARRLGALVVVVVVVLESLALALSGAGWGGLGALGTLLLDRTLNL